MEEFEIPNIPNDEKQSYYNNKSDIIIKKSFQKNGYEKIIYKNLSKLKNKLIYGLKLPEIIIPKSLKGLPLYQLIIVVGAGVIVVR